MNRMDRIARQATSGKRTRSVCEQDLDDGVQWRRSSRVRVLHGAVYVNVDGLNILHRVLNRHVLPALSRAAVSPAEILSTVRSLHDGSTLAQYLAKAVAFAKLKHGDVSAVNLVYKVGTSPEYTLAYGARFSLWYDHLFHCAARALVRLCGRPVNLLCANMVDRALSQRFALSAQVGRARDDMVMILLHALCTQDAAVVVPLTFDDYSKVEQAFARGRVPRASLREPPEAFEHEVVHHAYMLRASPSGPGEEVACSPCVRLRYNLLDTRTHPDELALGQRCASGAHAGTPARLGRDAFRAGRDSMDSYEDLLLWRLLFDSCCLVSV